jgi:ubiquilin
MSTIALHFKRANGAKITLEDVDATTLTVRDARARVAARLAESDATIDASANVRLIFKGRVLRDEATLAACGCANESVVHVVTSTTSTTTTTTTTTTATATAATAAATATTAIGGRGTATASDAPFGGFGGGGAALGGSGALDLMNNPFVRSQMEALLSERPETLREMMESQPGMREAMAANPELASALTDPETLRRMMNTMTNPSLMAEQMRNNDRAMSNIEMMPGGFNALRRMYTDVQAPMERAAERDMDAAAPTATRTVNPDEPLPNPWGGAGGGAGGGGAAMPPAGGGFSMGGIGGGAGASQIEQMAEMMQNPQMRAAMDSVMSNPQMLESMLNMHPQARQMMEANPQMRETLSNPEFLRQMMNPENLRAMAQMQQLFGDAMPGGGLGGGLGGSMFAPPVAPAGPPEEVYASQLSQLNDMGFFSQEENIRALQATGGNVHAAVERLLSNPGGGFA